MIRGILNWTLTYPEIPIELEVLRTIEALSVGAVLCLAGIIKLYGRSIRMAPVQEVIAPGWWGHEVLN